jgi:hypothetical protein
MSLGKEIAMDRRKLLVVGIVLCSFAAVVCGEPSLAVLDAVLDEGIDSAVMVPITEKIIEQVVASKKYVVLDRANIAQVLSEKEFQFSGMVKDTEIKQAGEYLGADFVGVARVSKVGETYFISAKIISVETGAITAQASAEKKGDADVVFDLARTVGVKLMGGVLTPEEEAVLVEAEVEPEMPRERKLFAQKEEDEGVKSHVVVSFLYPIYFGSAIVEVVDFLHQMDADTILLVGYDWWSPTYGVDIHYLQVFLRFFYASASISYMQRLFVTDFDEYGDFELLDLKAHVGGIFGPFPNFQIYAGLGAGYLMQTMGNYWGVPLLGYGFNYPQETGISINAEVGADYILFRFISLSARASFVLAPSMSNWTFYSWNESLGYFGIQVGAGIAY